MKWLVDAQLPGRFAQWMRAQGEDVVHSTDLPCGNRTTDRDICVIADREDRIVVSKDRDFLESHQVVGTPKRLVYVRFGNLSNNDLLTIAATEFSVLRSLATSHACIEWTKAGMILHG